MKLKQQNWLPLLKLWLDEFITGFVIGVLVTAVLMYCFSTPARADEESIWLTTGEWSRHNNNTDCPWVGAGCHDKYRQNNTGIGIEYHIDDTINLIGGYYHNSIYRETFYAGATYTPYHFGIVRVGFIGALATGYVDIVPAVPIGALFATAEYERVGLNVFWLPKVVVAASLKWRL